MVNDTSATPTDARTDKDDVYGSADYLDRNLPSGDTLNEIESAFERVEQSDDPDERIDALEEAVGVLSEVVIAAFERGNDDAE